MNIMMSYIVTLVIFSSFTWLISVVLRQVFRQKYDRFVFLLMGLVLSVAFFAVFVSKGQTILMFSIPIVGGLLFVGKTEKCKIVKEDWMFLSRLLLLTILFSMGTAFFQLDDSGLLSVVHSHDNLYNAKMSNFLLEGRKESVNWNYFDPSSVSSSPYHYFESWLIALINNFSGLNFYFLTVLVVIPYFASLIILGAHEVLTKLNVSSVYKWSSILVPFFSGLYFYPISNIDFFKFANKYSANAIDSPWALKMAVLYLFLLGFVNLVLTKQLRSAIMLLLLLPLFSIVSAPIVLPSVVLLVLISLLRKTNSFKWVDLLIPIGVFLCIVLFYSGNSAGQGLSVPKISSFIDSFLQVFTRKRIVILIEYIIYIVVLYLPFMIAFSYRFVSALRKKKSFFTNRLNPVFLYFVFSLVVGGVFWQFSFNMFGGAEFFFLNCVPILNIGFFFSLVLAFNAITNKYITGICFSSLIALTILFGFRSASELSDIQQKFSSRYSPEFIKEVHRKSDVITGMGVKVENSEGIGGVLINPFVPSGGEYLEAISGEVTMSSLNYCDIDTNNFLSWEKNFYITDPFVMYLQEKDTFDTIDSLRIKFIREYKIKFILVQGNHELDDFYKPLVEEVIRDDISKDKIYILKPWK
jgi:hypothetical protein